jgi:hypothetical protein
MNNPVVKYLSIVFVASLPLAWLTARAFLGGPGARAADAAIPVCDPDAPTAAKLEAELRAIAEWEKSHGPTHDPAGFVGVAEDDQSQLVFRLTETLALAAAANASFDAAEVDKARVALERLVATESSAIEGLPSRGREILAAAKQGASLLDRHSAWLEDRRVVRETLEKASNLLDTDPDGESEARCLELLHALRKSHSAVVGDGDPAEPAKALTAREDSEAKRLEARGACRCDYVKAAGLKDSPPTSAAQWRSRWNELDTFVAKHAGTPDERERKLVEGAGRRAKDAELAFKKESALEAGTAAELVTRIQAWRTAASAAAPREADHHRAQAEEMGRDWLGKRIPRLPAAPHLKALAALEEGVIDDGTPTGKRRIGVFQQVPNDPTRYRWWASAGRRVEKDPHDLKQRKWPRGEPPSPFSLKRPPGKPRYLVMYEEYVNSREAFVERDVQDNALSFAEVFERLAEEWDEHQKVPNANPDDGFEDKYADLSAACRRAAQVIREYDDATRARANGQP